MCFFSENRQRRVAYILRKILKNFDRKYLVLTNFRMIEISGCLSLWFLLKITILGVLQR